MGLERHVWEGFGLGWAGRGMCDTGSFKKMQGGQGREDQWAESKQSMLILNTRKRVCCYVKNKYITATIFVSPKRE